MRVAIVGNGTVSKAVQALLKPEELLYIYVRNKDKCVNEKCCFDYEKILASDIDTVIEVINNDEANPFIIAALKAHKHVITANKLTLALHMSEYLQLAKANGVQLAFEASCGGSLPIIHELQRMKRVDQISALGGILNGTSNFILDQMEQNGLEFSAALKRAQELGYAEADPKSDISGLDSLRKLFILSQLALDARLDSAAISCEGIEQITAGDIAFFKRKGQRLRLIAKMIARDGAYWAAVEPAVLSKDDPAANTFGCDNYFYLNSNSLKTLGFMGKGAGGLPTANAIINDLRDIEEAARPLPVLELQLPFDDAMIKERYVVRTQAKEDVMPYLDHCEGEYQYTIALGEAEKRALLKELRKKDGALFYARVEG